MKFHRGCWVGAALLAAGCANQPSAPAPGQLLTAPQHRAKLHTDLAQSYYAAGQMGVALEELNKAISADPDWGPAYNVLGLVNMELREDATAQKDFERALRINPNDAEAHNNYGWFLCRHKQEDAAIKHFFAALKDPLYSAPDGAYANAGVCALQKGDEKSAEDFFRKAVGLNPGQREALFHLAEFSYRRQNLNDAKDYLTRYMLNQNTIPSADALWLGVRLERRLGNRDSEASYATQLMKRFPGTPQAQALQAGKFD